MKKNLFLILLCFLSALCLWFAQIRREQLNLAGRIAPQILRFHVIANSNSSEDQEIKLNVKSYLLEHIYQEFTKSFPQKNPTKEDLKSFLLTHREDLESDTKNYIRQMGKSYPVSLEITWCEIPEKTYGNLRLPAGTYEAAQLKIGAARGHNWWCVLYPKVCITKDALTAVPDSSLEELSQILSPEDYQKLLLERPAFMPNIRFSFFTFEKLGLKPSSPDNPQPANEKMPDYSVSSPSPFTPQ